MHYFSGKGDYGESSLFNGEMVLKDDPILEFIGTIDELSAQIGLAISLTSQEDIKNTLVSIQSTISIIMSMVAGAVDNDDLDFDLEIHEIEDLIENYAIKIIPPKRFSFPGITSSGAALDVCRVFARKVERRTVSFTRDNTSLNKNIISYFNRLSSLFFVLRLFVDKTEFTNPKEKRK